MDRLLNSLSIIDNIENTRKANNKNWMCLLRLAFTLDPIKTREILKDIIEKDEKVIKAFKELVNADNKT